MTWADHLRACGLDGILPPPRPAVTLAPSTYMPLDRTPPAADALLAAAEDASRAGALVTAVSHLLAAAGVFTAHGMPQRARDCRGAALRIHEALVAAHKPVPR